MRHDSFANNMTASLDGAGSYAWRGVEGSVRDAEPNLVHMQARHYDPTLGRFIQADSLMLASFTTQGMNRYIYTENDPVNKSDPSGQFAPAAAFAAAFAIGIFVGGIAAALLLSDTVTPLGAALRQMMMMIFLKNVQSSLSEQCKLAFERHDKMLADLMTRGLLSSSGYLSLMMRTGFGFVGLGFGIGFSIGFALTSMVLLAHAEPRSPNRRRDDDGEFAQLERLAVNLHRKSLRREACTSV